jgi:hypothetical protein
MNKHTFFSRAKRTALSACKLILIITAFLSTAGFAQEQTPVDISVKLKTPLIRFIGDTYNILSIQVNMELNSQASGIIATVELPEGVTFLEGGYDGIPCTNVDNLVTCNFGSLASGERKPIDYLQGVSIRLQFPNEVRELTFTARVKANEPDPNLSDNTTTIKVNIVKSRKRVRFL